MFINELINLLILQYNKMFIFINVTIYSFFFEFFYSNIVQF